MKEYVFILQGEPPESAEHDLAKEIESVSSKYGLESYLDDIKEPQSKMSCEGCGSTNLDFLARVDLNTNQILHNFDLDGLKCDNCGGIESWRIKESNIDGEQCGHGNSWSANCSDCDEEESEVE